FDPDGKRLVSADSVGTVKVWDANGQPVTSLPAHARDINHIAFRPDGKRLATASIDGTCKAWDTEKGDEVHSRPPGTTAQAVAWTQDGKRLAAGDDNEVRVWNAETGEVIHTLKTPVKGLLAFDPDGNFLFTAREIYGKDGRHAFTRWNVATGTLDAT